MTPTPPPMIRTDLSNAFAHDTMKVRVPGTIRETLALNPDYPASIREALVQMAEDIAGDAPIPRISPLSPDYDCWAESLHQHDGHTWQGTDWFFAETYFYRLLIEAVRWWESGRDPFTPKKEAELGGDGIRNLLDGALALRDHPRDERLAALIHAAIWANRIDLSFAASMAHGGIGSTDDLLADDTGAVVDHLARTAGDAHIIADNTGTELALDMALADALMDDPAWQVTLHLKMHPTFVSDAIPADFWILVRRMSAGEYGTAAERLAGRLHKHWSAGRLRLAPDFYWNSSRLLWDMPERLVGVFRGAALAVIKGDANYRRMVGDALWPVETPFAAVTGYFPAPLLALRTLKSDPIVGLQAGMDARLDALDPRWRVNGKRGVIQFR